MTVFRHVLGQYVCHSMPDASLKEVDPWSLCALLRLPVSKILLSDEFPSVMGCTPAYSARRHQ